MTPKEAREIIKVGVLPGDIDSIDFAMANGFIQGMEYERERAAKLVDQLVRTNKLMYGLGLDLRQSSLAQKILDENRKALSDYKKEDQ